MKRLRYVTVDSTDGETQSVQEEHWSRRTLNVNPKYIRTHYVLVWKLAKLKVGDAAPAFSLYNEHGHPVSLRNYLGKKVVVLYFYPKDFAPTCTAEALSFRDDYKSIQDKGAVVLGVNPESVESHSKFHQVHHLPFTILSDQKKEVAEAYGVLGTGGFLVKRVTFIINKEGKITHIFPKVNVKHHAEEVLKALKEL